MVVRLVKPPDTAAESEPLADANSVSADATEHAGDGLTDWTFLGSVPSSVPTNVSQLHGVSQDVPVEHESSHGLFGEPLEFSVDENDPDAVSLSAEPSIARSSDVGFDDRQLQTRTVIQHLMNFNRLTLQQLWKLQLVQSLQNQLNKSGSKGSGE